MPEQETPSSNTKPSIATATAQQSRSPAAVAIGPTVPPSFATASGPRHAPARAGLRRRLFRLLCCGHTAPQPQMLFLLEHPEPEVGLPLGASVCAPGGRSCSAAEVAAAAPLAGPGRFWLRGVGRIVPGWWSSSSSSEEEEEEDTSAITTVALAAALVVPAALAAALASPRPRVGGSRPYDAIVAATLPQILQIIPYDNTKQINCTKGPTRIIILRPCVYGTKPLLWCTTNSFGDTTNRFYGTTIFFVVHHEYTMNEMIILRRLCSRLVFTVLFTAPRLLCCIPQTSSWYHDLTTTRTD